MKIQLQFYSANSSFRNWFSTVSETYAEVFCPARYKKPCQFCSRESLFHEDGPSQRKFNTV